MLELEEVGGKLTAPRNDSRAHDRPSRRTRILRPARGLMAASAEEVGLAFLSPGADCFAHSAPMAGTWQAVARPPVPPELLTHTGRSSVPSARKEEMSAGPSNRPISEGLIGAASTLTISSPSPGSPASTGSRLTRRVPSRVIRERSSKPFDGSVVMLRSIVETLHRQLAAGCSGENSFIARRAARDDARTRVRQ